MAQVNGPRTRMSAEERREQILDITHAIVDAEGFHGATPNRIAEAAGITRPVLYQQFGDLAGLFVSLVDREARRAAAQFGEAISEPEDRDEADPFVTAFDGVLAAVDTHPATWRLFLCPAQGAPPELHERLSQAQDVVRRHLEEQLVRAFPDLTDPDYTARMLHAAGRELLQLRLTDPERATSERLRSLVRHLRALGGVARPDNAVSGPAPAGLVTPPDSRDGLSGRGRRRRPPPPRAATAGR